MELPLGDPTSVGIVTNQDRRVSFYGCKIKMLVHNFYYSCVENKLQRKLIHGKSFKSRIYI